MGSAVSRLTKTITMVITRATASRMTTCQIRPCWIRLYCPPSHRCVLSRSCTRKYGIGLTEIRPLRTQLFPRVSTQEARVALSALQRAFTDAERIIPGVTLELINEIVDSVERVDEDR